MFGMRNKKKATEYVDSEIPVTPMLDMAFQIMAFFVFTFQPSPKEGSLALKLPKLEGGPATAVSLDDNNPLEQKSVYVIELGDSAGELATIIFKNEAEVGSSKDFGNQLATLEDELERLAAGEEKPRIRIEAAPELRYAEVIRVMDACVKHQLTDLEVTELTTRRLGGEENP